MAISRRRISFFVYTLCMCCVHLRATQRQLHGIIYRLHRPKVRLMYSSGQPWACVALVRERPCRMCSVGLVGGAGRAVLAPRPATSASCRPAPARELGRAWWSVCVGGCTAARARWRGRRAGACVGREGHGGGGGGGEWGVSSLLKYLCRQGCVGSLLPALPPNEIGLHHAPGP